MPEGEDVDHRAADDLVDPVADRQHRRGAPPSSGADGDAARPGRPTGCRRRWPTIGAGEGAGEQHALDGDVDDARALAQHAGQGAEGQRGRPPQRAVEQADELTSSRPGAAHASRATTNSTSADAEHDGSCGGGSHAGQLQAAEAERRRRRARWPVGPGRHGEVGDRHCVGAGLSTNVASSPDSLPSPNADERDDARATTVATPKPRRGPRGRLEQVDGVDDRGAASASAGAASVRRSPPSRPPARS